MFKFRDDIGIEVSANNVIGHLFYKICDEYKENNVFCFLRLQQVKVVMLYEIIQ